MADIPPDQDERKDPVAQTTKTPGEVGDQDREAVGTDMLEDGVDPVTGEFRDPDPGTSTLPHVIPSLPDELKEEAQPMSPETARALAEAGYQLSLTGNENTSEQNSEQGLDGTRVEASDPEQSLARLEDAPVSETPEFLSSTVEEGEPTVRTDEGSVFQDGPTPFPEPLGRASLFRVLLARETLPHFGILALLMIIFLALSFSDNADHGDWLVALSLGGMAAYALMGVMALTPLVETLRNPRFGWVIPLVLTLVLAGILRQVLLVDNNKAGDYRDLLALAMVGLFLLWQFMQAWWMRVPFENWAMKRFAPPDDEARSEANDEEEADWGGPVGAIDRMATRMAGKGPLLNAIAPIVWALVGLGLFELLYELDIFKPEKGAFFEAYDTFFRVMWLATMTVVGLLLMLVVRRMLRWAPSSGRVALFSGAFAFGFWVFLAYHAFALFWSLAQEPSFAFDLLFMLITILVAIYSLSSRAINVAGGLVRPENVLFFGIAFGISYSGANFFLISDFGGGFDPREVGYLSHLIAGLFGALVLLLANASFMNLEGHIRYGGLRGLGQGLGAIPTSLSALGQSPTGNEPDPRSSTSGRVNGSADGTEENAAEDTADDMGADAGDEPSGPIPQEADGDDEPLQYPRNNLIE